MRSMTPRTVEAEIETDPFKPVRLHLSSGKTLDIKDRGAVWYLSYGLMVFHRKNPARKFADRYDLINYRLIERIEQLSNGHARARRPKS